MDALTSPTLKFRVVTKVVPYLDVSAWNILENNRLIFMHVESQRDQRNSNKSFKQMLKELLILNNS